MSPNTSTKYNYSDAELKRIYEAYVTPWPTGIVTAAVLMLLVFIGYCLFVTFLLLHGPHRHQLKIQLAASCILAHLPMAIFLHPGTIHLFFLMKPMTTSYCWLWVHFKPFTEIIIPYTLLMFSIERLMYIRNPTGHAQRIKRAGHVTLLVCPWVIALILSIIDVNVPLQELVTKRYFSSQNATQFIVYTCLHLRGNTRLITDIIMRLVIGGMVPLWTCLIITIIVVVMWFFFKRKHALGRDYSMMGEQVEVVVRNSVIAVSVLNFVYIITFVAEAGTRNALRFGYAMINLYAVVEGLVWILTFVEVRNKFVALFTCGRKKVVAEIPAVNYKPEDANAGND